MPSVAKALPVFTQVDSKILCVGNVATLIFPILNFFRKRSKKKIKKRARVDAVPSDAKRA